MGQKVNPYSFRVGPTLIKNWNSVLYSKSDYSKFLLQDLSIRKLINDNYLYTAGISKIVIERPSNKSVIVNIHVKKPGVIIGKNGSDIEKLKNDIQKLVYDCDIYINLHEIKKINIDAVLVAQSIAAQLKKRVSFRKAMKTCMQLALKQGALGIKISCSGRLGGVEIARTEWYREGRVPLHTLRSDIDYAVEHCVTTYGVIGIKVWIYKGDFLEFKKNNVKR